MGTIQGVTTDTDNRDRTIAEFYMSKDERIRVTYIPDPEWVGEPTIRIQKRGANGHLFQGEEFPASKAMKLLGAIAAVMPE